MDLPKPCVVLVLHHLSLFRRREHFLATRRRLAAWYSHRPPCAGNTVTLRISARVELQLTSDACQTVVRVCRHGWNPLNRRLSRGSFVYSWMQYRYLGERPMVSWYRRDSAAGADADQLHPGFGDALHVLLAACHSWPSRDGGYGEALRARRCGQAPLQPCP